MAKKHLDSIAVRTLFLSDLHLGTKGCQAGLLLDFLKHCDVDTIYLVGDVVDGWRLKQGWYWPESHNNVVRKLLKRVHKGVKIIYIPGNHDEFMRDYVGHNFGGIDVMDTAIHEAADGKRFLVMHGDQFDLVVRHAPWLAVLGDGAYELALWINTYLNMIRRRFGLDYWSLSSWAKLKVKSAVNHIGRFESALSGEARRRDAYGVICGHIHHAVIHDDFGVRYMNTGDWVESCTALVEHFDGRFEIIHWADKVREAKEALAAAQQQPEIEASAA
ncbi:MAG: UDP-2,3-diacylglucosamine diphosphatase [Pseudomonadota bacterium]